MRVRLNKVAKSQKASKEESKEVDN